VVQRCEWEREKRGKREEGRGKTQTCFEAFATAARMRKKAGKT
jgi:hypothetical protein